MPKYFCDYYAAKEYAEKRNMLECEYGDTGYWARSEDEPISYCAWNPSGKREDEWEVEAYYTWTRIDGRLKPIPIDKGWVHAETGEPTDEIGG